MGTYSQTEGTMGTYGQTEGNMGTYNQSGEEIEEKFLKFLKDASEGEGDISADAIAEAWNRIAKRMKFGDRLMAYDVDTLKQIIKGEG